MRPLQGGLFIEISLFLISQPVSKAHQAVAKVDVLHRDVGILHGQIVVAEIPEALDALVHQFPGQIHGALARHAE